MRIIQRANKLPIRALIQEVPTCCNSIYYILQCLFAQYKAINDYVIQRGGDATATAMTMEVDKWRLVTCLTQMLLHFKV